MMRFCLNSPLGTLAARVDGGFVTGLALSDAMPPTEENRTDLALATALRRELDEYFAGERQTFDLPLKPAGTPFQQQVRQALTEIPWGETRTYGEIAAAIGQPNASRAVGGACHRNPILILIPCHRVVASSGLGGFGCGTENKKILLSIEKQT